MSHTHININNLAYNDKTETDAVDNLEKLNKSSGNWSNVANVASTVMQLSGLKIKQSISLRSPMCGIFIPSLGCVFSVAK
ncbi:hypothetical protein [Pseudoalteromonas luteoviolacea]|uniref:hypothetical protein n=1 Tax=Pseudoalteromonas luteoviolacea TaxID=43657 RepID=UPI0012DA282C|nr:hypothetical protein [Pseudoalteromonas luteoviolacea]